MDQDKVQAEARLVAIEYLLRRLHLIIYKAAGATSDEIKNAHAKILHVAWDEIYPTTDPAKSMLAASEIEDALRHQLAVLDRVLRDAGLLK